MSSIIASLFSSFAVHADAPTSEEPPVDAVDADSKGEKASEESEPEPKHEEPKHEEEEPEPEDVRVFNAHHSESLSKTFIFQFF
jgi:hypothetical protein